ncbi:hypothetical protein KXS11_01370 [Plantibacter flavus]|uniref:hypothetical protein n=1 Tax=Plantibacter flavus TaxID=150123 RepID=UPI003F1522C3
MKLKTMSAATVSLIAGALVLGVGGTWAGATEQDPVHMFVRTDGELVDVQDEFERYAVALPNPAPDRQSNDGASRLIDFGQWVSCFSLNNSQDVYASYTHWWNGSGHDVRLKCGQGDRHSGWGYKHIRDGKEADWQAKLDGARGAGWVPGSQGVESWDDLMAGAAASAVTFPEYKGGNAINNTSCGVTTIYFGRVSNPEQVVYSFRVRAAWANDSDRLITAFPQSGESC